MIEINNFKIIESIFQIKSGDIVQIFDNNHWSNLGIIKDKRQAQIEFGVNNFNVMGKSARIIRKI